MYFLGFARVMTSNCTHGSDMPLAPNKLIGKTVSVCEKNCEKYYLMRKIGRKPSFFGFLVGSYAVEPLNSTKKMHLFERNQGTGT